MMESQDIFLKEKDYIEVEIRTVEQFMSEIAGIVYAKNPNPSLMDLNLLFRVLSRYMGVLRAKLPQHGTQSEYQKGCRCEKCKGAKASYMKQYTALKRKKK